MRNRMVWALVVCASCFAGSGSVKVFVSSAQLDARLILPTPAAFDSAEMRAELAELHRLQDARTPEQIARARADDGEEDMFVFRTVLGENFRRDLLPATALLSDHVHANEGVIVNPAKTYFHRPRPYRFDSTIHPVCKVSVDPSNYSYPGGHATTGYLEALVLAMIVPEKRDEILLRADDYAHNRLVCGVHYPSDLVASKSVAYAIIGIMVNNAQFAEELAAAKAETRRALGL